MFFKKKTTQTKLIKRITIYISDRHKHLIIAPGHENDAGISYEQEKCFSAGFPINSADLGTEIINNLNLYSKKDKNLRDNKLTDWPAYQHSKAKSVKSFEKEYITIFVSGANDNNLVLEVSGLSFKECELTINSSISFYADKEELGQKILKVYNACLSGVYIGDSGPSISLEDEPA